MLLKSWVKNMNKASLDEIKTEKDNMYGLELDSKKIDQYRLTQYKDLILKLLLRDGNSEWDYIVETAIKARIIACKEKKNASVFPRSLDQIIEDSKKYAE